MGSLGIKRALAFTGGSDLAAFGTGGGLGTTSFATGRALAVGRNLGAGGGGGVNRRPNFGTPLVAFGITADEGLEEGKDVATIVGSGATLGDTATEGFGTPLDDAATDGLGIPLADADAASSSSTTTVTYSSSS